MLKSLKLLKLSNLSIVDFKASSDELVFCLIDYKNPIFKPKKGKDFDDNPNHIN